MPLLPEALSHEYEVRAATEDDAEALQQLFVAHRTSILGVCRVTVQEVRSWLAAPPERTVVDLIVRRRHTGLAVQWWSGSHERDDVQYLWLINTRPDVLAGEADGLWSAGWSHLRGWVDGIGDDAGDERVVRSACLLGDAENQRRLAEAGFVHERTFWEMAGPTSGGGAAVEVPGLVIGGHADPAAVHAVIQEGFHDHWGFHPQPFDAWLAAQQAGLGYDASWWYLAKLDDEPAAAMILCRYDDELYVQEVATLPEFRRRGIAAALLAQAFAAAREAGLAAVMLHVDSDNADRAPRLYRAAGLRVRHATLQHTLRR